MVKALGKTYDFTPPSADKVHKIGSTVVRLQCTDAQANLVHGKTEVSHFSHTSQAL